MRKTFTAAFAIMIGIALSGSKTPSIEPIKVDPQPKASPKIQAAILLDVSGSMEGLIEQAKAQLWNMVSVMGKVKCEEGAPQIEIALYEYGRPSNGATVGFVKQLSPFSSDLNFLSQELFKLKTDGGDEYCGQVIYTSLSELAFTLTIFHNCAFACSISPSMLPLTSSRIAACILGLAFG